MLSNKEFNELRKEMGELLEPLAGKYGIHITVGKITYSNIDCSIKVEMGKVDPDGKPQEQAEFERLCGMYGFGPKDYLMPFQVEGRGFVLTGFNPKARSMPYLAKDQKTGQEYKFRHSALAKQTAGNPGPKEEN